MFCINIFIFEIEFCKKIYLVTENTNIYEKAVLQIWKTMLRTNKLMIVKKCINAKIAKTKINATRK